MQLPAAVGVSHSLRIGRRHPVTTVHSAGSGAQPPVCTAGAAVPDFCKAQQAADDIQGFECAQAQAVRKAGRSSIPALRNCQCNSEPEDPEASSSLN